MQKKSKRGERIELLLSPVNAFIKSESSSGIILFICAAAAMVLANSPLSTEYFHFWEYELSISFGSNSLSQDLHHWVNDGLMGIFFFVIGLELKREIIGGELSTPRKAVLPFAAGLGGMLVPALFYFIFNKGGEGVHGWGIPMATDIAFALGIMALLGKRIPLSLKVFLTALAIADDLGAVMVIAFFYTSNIEFYNLLIGGGFFGALVLMNYLGVRNTFAYGLIGIGGVWLAFMLSGVHATIAGVLAALAIPARTRIDENLFSRKMDMLLEKFKLSKPNKNRLITSDQLHVLETMRKTVKASETPLQRLEHKMHALVAFFIMPVFALANAGIELKAEILGYFTSPVTLGIMVGLVIGKFVGIVFFSKLMVKLKWASLPEYCNWYHVYGVALLAGVGFTMSLFITKLAFANEEIIYQAKLGVMSASVIAGVLGFFVLRYASNRDKLPKFAEDQEPKYAGPPIGEIE